MCDNFVMLHYQSGLNNVANDAIFHLNRPIILSYISTNAFHNNHVEIIKNV